MSAAARQLLCFEREFLTLEIKRSKNVKKILLAKMKAVVLLKVYVSLPRLENNSCN